MLYKVSGVIFSLCGFELHKGKYLIKKRQQKELLACAEADHLVHQIRGTYKYANYSWLQVRGGGRMLP